MYDIPLQAPMTLFRRTYYADSQFVGLLSSGFNSIMVLLWNDIDQIWQLSSPTVLQGLQNHSSLASNDDGHVFALQDGNIKEFSLSRDGASWSFVGNVTVDS